MTIGKPYCIVFFKDGHWNEEYFRTENEMESHFNIWFYDDTIEVHFYKDDIEYIPAWVE